MLIQSNIIMEIFFKMVNIVGFQPNVKSSLCCLIWQLELKQKKIDVILVLSYIQHKHGSDWRD